RLPVTDQLRNGPRASLHGGVLAAVVDAAIASALATLLPEDTEAGALTATLDLNITYISAVREGELRAEGRILRRGRSIAFGQTDIFDATGELVSTGRATYRIRGTAAGG
ncbi:MAG TPA: PaaI family thioesterase, partial [Dehalococcoidia bacterium]|nr:PaaI family thioesterase [Dehalococcoidia bacterium]